MIRRSYGIPARCLIAAGAGNLVVAGRCLSATHEAASSARGQPVCMATGHAAGTIAALAALRGVAAREVPIRDIQSTLAAQGAVLDRPSN